MSRQDMRLYDAQVLLNAATDRAEKAERERDEVRLRLFEARQSLRILADLEQPVAAMAPGSLRTVLHALGDALKAQYDELLNAHDKGSES